MTRGGKKNLQKCVFRQEARCLVQLGEKNGQKLNLRGD